jgi:hypothetical protein
MGLTQSADAVESSASMNMTGRLVVVKSGRALSFRQRSTSRITGSTPCPRMVQTRSRSISPRASTTYIRPGHRTVAASSSRRRQARKPHSSFSTLPEPFSAQSLAAPGDRLHRAAAFVAEPVRRYRITHTDLNYDDFHLTPLPFPTYYQLSANSTLTCPRLLVIGYRGGAAIGRERVRGAL